MLLTLFLAFVVEYPLADTLRDGGLSLVIVRKGGRRKDATVEIAAGLRAIFIDGAAVVHQHGTAPLLVVAHQQMSLRQAWGLKEQGAGNTPNGFGFGGPDVDEHGRTATASASAARHIRSALPRFQGSLGTAQPLREVAGRHAGCDLD